MEEGEELGNGSYGRVVKLKFRQLTCAGKRFYCSLYKSLHDEQKERLQQRWYKECTILGSLRHPNIVQFLGVYFEEQPLPVLVMEFVPFTLSHHLDKHGIFPQEISYGILVDIAKALSYLHSGDPLIIHRDLSANNILLTFEMRAKISDLGTAKILDVTPAQKGNMSICPGTLCYMPPEALTLDPKYRTEIDCFSYGVIILHIFCGRWPIPDGQKVADDSGAHKARTELDRRECYLSILGHDHLLTDLTKKCLSDAPSDRPHATEILSCVQKIAENYPREFDSALTMTRKIETLRESLTEEKHRLSRQYKEYCDQLETMSNSYNQHIAKLLQQMDDRVCEERRKSETEKNRLEQEWNQEREHLKTRNRSLSAKVEDANLRRSIDVSIMTSQVSQLMADNSQLSNALRTERAENDNKMNQMKVVIEMKTKECDSKCSELEEKNTELEMKKKNISSLQTMNKTVTKELNATKKELEVKKDEDRAAKQRLENMHLLHQCQKECIDAMTKQLETKQSELTASQLQVGCMTELTERIQRELDHQHKQANAKEESLREQISLQDQLLEKTKEEVELMRNHEIPALKSKLETKEGIIRDLIKQEQRVMKLLAQKDNPLSSRIQLEFKSLSDIPMAMTDLQCVVIDNRVYVGGGRGDDKSEHTSQTQIFEYSESHDQWTVLTQTSTRFFALTSYKGKLVSIGGMTAENTISGHVSVFDLTKNTWNDKVIPPILTKRFFLAVISHRSRLAVFGGVTQGGSTTDVVEVFLEGQWYKAPSLPDRICLAKPVVYDNMCYLISGLFSCGPEAPTKSVICITLSELFSIQDSSDQEQKAWRVNSSEESSTINYRSAVANFGGMLLSIGGWIPALSTTTSDIVAYSSTANAWVKIGKLPEPRSSFGATAIPQSGQVLMFGGLERTPVCTTNKTSSSVYRMTLAL